MRILFVTPYTPSVIRRRPFSFLQVLQALGHEITLATVVSGKGEEGELERLRVSSMNIIAGKLVPWRSYWNCLSVLPTKEPLQAAFCWTPELAKQLGKINPNQFDVVHVEHLRGARYGLLLRRLFPQLPIVWDSVDCISLLFAQASNQGSSRLSRLLTRFDLERTRKYEGWLLQQFDHVLTTSESDKGGLTDLSSSQNNAPISVVTNGVDLDYFRPSLPAEREPDTLIFSGKMSYHANVTMAQFLVQDILPLVQQKRPATTLKIVGKEPGHAIRKLGESQGVKVTGEVTDLGNFLRTATVAVAPVVYGVGIQNKILEALASGTPLVTTSAAMHSLDAKAGRDLLIGNTASELAQQIINLMENTDLRRSVGSAGRAYVEQYHDWRVIGKQLENIYRGIIVPSSVQSN